MPFAVLKTAYFPFYLPIITSHHQHTRDKAEQIGWRPCLHFRHNTKVIDRTCCKMAVCNFFIHGCVGVCPNIFEIRDAMERLDESEYNYFVKWCCYHGHSLATGDASLLVAYFQDMCGSSAECGNEPPGLSEEVLLSQCLNGSYFAVSRYATEMFDEDYD